MAFYSLDDAMGQRLSQALSRLEEAGGSELVAGLSITWLRYPRSLFSGSAPAESRQAGERSPADPGPGGRGASWQGSRVQDPGPLVQLVYLAAVERWLQRDLLEEEPELRRATEAMIRKGSLEATSYVVDRLSGTTSGPSLPLHRQAAWIQQRQLVNAWLASLGWPELEGCSATQKLWQDGPYGRERQGWAEPGELANRLSSDAVARLLEAVLAGRLISPPASQRMRALLLPDSGMDPFPLLGALPAGMRLWGQGGAAGGRFALALYGERPECPPVLLVLLADQPADGEAALSSLVADLLEAALPG